MKPSPRYAGNQPDFLEPMDNDLEDATSPHASTRTREHFERLLQEAEDILK